MKTHVLVVSKKDYADEFDCEFFGIFKFEDWNRLCKKTEKAWGNILDFEVYFGTNECMIYDNYQDWLDSFKIREITAEEAKFLRQCFGSRFGTGSAAFDAATILKEQSEENEFLYE